MNRRLTRMSNRIAVLLYRASHGYLVTGRTARVLVITVPGRRTGRPRSTCVRFLSTDEGLLVWGTASGSPEDPDWFRNLRTAGSAEVQVGGHRIHVRPRELVGAERETAWHNTVLARASGVDRYARKAGRPIPVAILTR
jgi:F420H(2)-dependent quinone reductase